MNKDQAKQVLDALTAMQMEAAARNCGLQICDEAIAIMQRELDAPEVEPVEPETHCPHGVDVYSYCKLCDMEVSAQFDALEVTTTGAPQERKPQEPLTESQIITKMPPDIPPSYDGHLIKFARAIEAAHGIGVEK